MASGDYLQLHLVQAINLLAVIDFTSECGCLNIGVSSHKTMLISSDFRRTFTPRLDEDRSFHTLCTGTPYDV
jgi:hypothetical protein